jgi:protein TonB
MYQSLLRKIDLKNKKTIAILGGLFSTFFIFLIIYVIILPSGKAFNSVKDSSVVDFVRLRKNDYLNERQRALPEKPPPPKKTTTAKTRNS